MKQTLLVALSATFFAQAFIFPSYLCWMIFIFLIPLCWVVVHNQLVLSDAFVWSGLFVLQAYWALFSVIFRSGHATYKYGALFSFYLYLTFYCALWLSGYIFIVRFISRPPLRLILLLLFCLLFFLMTPYIFCIFGLHTRNYFFNPLVCLAAHPHFLWAISLLPEWILFLCLLCINGILFLIITKDWRYVAFLLMPAMPFIMGFAPKRVLAPEYDYSHIGFVSVPPYNNECALERAQTIITSLLDYQEQNPTKKILLLPESTYPFALNNPAHVFFLEMLTYSLDDVFLLIGAHKRADGALTNCLYCIHDGRIMHDYDKKNLVPFFEYCAPIWNNTYCNKLFLNNKKEFSTSNKRGEAYFFIDNMKLYPYMCSEFFFEKHFSPHTIVVALINDSWFCHGYFKKLLELLAIYRAIQYELTIFYCSYSTGEIVDKCKAN